MTFKKNYLKALSALTGVAVFGLLAVFSSIYLYLSPKLPAVETLRQTRLQTPLRVFSSDSQLIGEFGEKRRQPVTYNDTPQDFINALLAAEDDGFYEHHGVDVAGLLRAASQLVSSGGIQSGGSTITMQVARNFFLTRKQTFTRKFNEILLALQIENELSKEEILELYVNKIYLGNRAYGIEAAAQVYYGKSIGELDLSQLAMIAGLPKAPSAFNPIVNPERATIRRNWILGRMLSLEMITVEEHNDAIKAPVSASYHGTNLSLDAPYVAEMARQKALEIFGEAAYTDGYSVYTTVDSHLQATAQQAVISGLINYDQRHGYRGPEARLQTTLLNDGSPALDSWQKDLRQYPTLGGIAAAVVIAIEETSARVMTADGSEITLHWETGFKHSRPFINENRRGPTPKAIQDFLQAGDVIRVKQDPEGHWELSQIPMAQAALVAITPDNGAIRSLVGGFDFKQSHFNRATQAERQPGSNFKPFIYTAALENGMTAASIINDAPIVFNDNSLEDTWRPENASGKFFGPTRLRQALYKSRNLVSIRVLRATGIDNTINSLGRFGFEPETLPKDLSLALGSHALTPLQVASAYTPFANGGFKTEPYLVERIEDAEGNIVYEADPLVVCRECELRNAEADTQAPEDNLTSTPQEPLPSEDILAMEEDIDTPKPAAEPRTAPRILSPEVAYLMDDMLRDVITKGTGRKARQLGRTDLAGKTGTTNGPKDAWFSGYNSHMVTTAWLGFDQNYALGRGEYGGTSALPIWIDFMSVALDGKPEAVRELPQGLISVRIDPKTGKRALPNTPGAIFETFRLENTPDFAEQSADTTEIVADETPPEELF